MGNGMAGARLADELARRSADVTVFGAEVRAAYNRVLLSDVLAGKRSDVALATVEGPVRRLGTEVVEVDRAAKTVRAADGSVTPYDALVLATGSHPVVPPVHGIADSQGKIVDGVFLFRTMEDCAAIADRTGRATQAIVIGGGLLGLEAARGLLEHGVPVDVVHGPDHLMDLQLDARGGDVLRRSVEALGVGVHLGSFASRVLGSRSVRGIGLADGRVVAGDLVVLACGVRPNADLARAAGLVVERGIVVDDSLRTSDPSIYALGECSQHRGQVYGLVAPAWEQAAVLADVLTGRGGAYTGSRLVTRLKAMDLEVCSVGDISPGLDDLDAEVVVYADPTRHVYKKVVLREGRVVGAVLVGDTSTAGTVTQAYERGTPVPADPAGLLIAPKRGSAVLDDEDTVCTCNAVTAGEIRSSGCRSVAEVALKTRATTGCGTCSSAVKALLGAATPERTVA